jgi:hypothetical protein
VWLNPNPFSCFSTQHQHLQRLARSKESGCEQLAQTKQLRAQACSTNLHAVHEAARLMTAPPIDKPNSRKEPGTRKNKKNGGRRHFRLPPRHSRVYVQQAKVDDQGSKRSWNIEQGQPTLIPQLDWIEESN